MSNQPSKDDEEEKDKSSSASNQRPIRGELLRKMYYPDTLYPDTYTFFASPRTRSTDTNEPTNNLRQSNTDIEMLERQSKYTVRIVVCMEKKGKCYFRQVSMSVCKP